MFLSVSRSSFVPPSVRPLRRPTTENAKPSPFAQQNGDLSEDIKVESTEVPPLKQPVMSDSEQKVRIDKKPTSSVADTIKLERKEVSTKPEPGNLKHYFSLRIASVCLCACRNVLRIAIET